MSKEDLKKEVSGWANSDGSKTEMWLKVLSDYGIDDLDALKLFEPHFFVRLLEKIDQPFLCQCLTIWYRSQFPDSKPLFFVIFCR
jgi:hypothetical protein